MNSGACSYQSVRGLRTFLGSAVFTCFVLALSSCSGNGNSGGDQNQAGSAVSTTGTAGQSNGTGGAQTTSAAAGTKGSQVGAGGTKVTTGTGGKKTAGAGGKAATAGKGGNGGTKATTGAGGKTAETQPPDVACNPADKTADATPVEFATPLEGFGISTPTGEFKPVMESDPGIPTHTIIRPDPIGKIKHPILAWGEGGCRKNGNEAQNTNLFREFASHGILIVADGPAVAGGPTMAGTNAAPLLFALEWAQKENERPCSKYYHKLNVKKVAVSGQSCGGLMAINAAVDPKITTAFPYDSGLFARDQTIYNALHAPMAIFNGGEGDIAYANGLADFEAIDNIPILFANPTSCSSNAHVCTFFEENAGEFGRAGVAWMRWHLFDDMGPTGKGMFIGDKCGLCGPAWTLQWKNAPK